MKIRTFTTELWLPRPVTEVFSFFSNAANLDAITPPWLSFRMVGPPPVMRAGIFIDYRLRVRGIPLGWRTRINVWEPPHRFVDEQIKGPYRQWIHEHTFESRDGGTVVRDKVEYAVPFDGLTHRWLVRPDIEKIFAYRTRALEKLFSNREAVIRNDTASTN